MHSFGFRANAVLTFGITILAFICAMASVSDNFNSPRPSAEIQILNINWFQKQHGNDEEILSLKLAVSLDLNVDVGGWHEVNMPDRRLCKVWDVVPICLFSPIDVTAVMASLTMNITADLQSLFTWNTKQVFVFIAAEYETPKNALNQVSLWDAIIPAKEHAKFWVQTANKYRFVDQGNNLRGKHFNLTLHWHVMPKTGKMFANKLVIPGYRLPEEYR
ncbi:unnamed protein product [Linum tenue]|uniref:Signal peptidase complex subunit 3 n=1 Tax=Linum tenue TaxID=586396 RepID=A0AAV0I302_9ROSI|nr:unnamed protein product [Linum tenue]